MKKKLEKQRNERTNFHHYHPHFNSSNKNMILKFSSSVLFATTIVALATASSSPSSSSASGTLRGQRDLKAKVVANRIVGGEQSTEGEFPYYVEVGYGCGGALIAPQVMLYAAHCTPSLGAGTSVQVGAYKAQSTQYGVKRKCTKVVDHPNYNKRTMDNDFALCKLNAPVTLDDDRAILVLNEEDSVPATGEDLIVMGVGALKEGGNSPQFLHNVTVPTISNTQCNKGSYYGGEITENMLCAGFDEGKKDSCQGDSGGPIVRRQWDAANSRFVDSHVGVVSWGYGCAAPKKPGVYARTSSGHEWIKDVVCNEFNAGDAVFCKTEPPTPTVSPKPTSAPTTASPTTGPPTLPQIDVDPVPVKSKCSFEDGQLQIKFKMDQYNYETTWYVEEKDTGRVVAANQDGYPAFTFNYEPPRNTKNVFRGPAKLSDSTVSLRGRGSTGTGLSPRAINSRYHNRIINGEDAKEGEYPYYVQVGYGCGGTLIAPQVVLYAAHCAEAGLDEGTEVQVGA